MFLKIKMLKGKKKRCNQHKLCFWLLDIFFYYNIFDLRDFICVFH